jgi:hypothetical protein
MTQWWSKYLLIGVLFTLSALTLYSQRPGAAGSPRPTGSPPAQQRGGEQQQVREVPDTVGVHIFFADRPDKETPFSDSLLDSEFHQYDPARKRKFDYLTTGNAGGAARPACYTPVFRRGLDMGLHQFDIYHTPASELPFYRIQKAFTNLAYYQQGEQANSNFTTQFARNFAKGVQFSLDYKRISHIGNLSQYPEQNSRQTALATGFRFHKPNSRYDAFGVFASNTSEQEDNGGLAREPVGVPGRPNAPSNADVFLRNAQTRYSFRELSYTQHWRFGGRTDSTGILSRVFPVMHRIIWADNRYKFFDREPGSHVNFYNRFPELLADNRGTRYFIRHQKLENTFQVATRRIGDRSSDQIEAGLVHALHWIAMEPQDTLTNHLLLTGRVALSPAPALRFEGYAQLSLLDNVGDYRLEGRLEVELPKAGKLEVRAFNQLNAPSFVQHRFLISQRIQWENYFTKILESGLSAQLQVDGMPFEIGGAYFLINNLVYFDTSGMPRQTGIPVSVLQATLIHRMRAGKFHLDNTAVFQRASEEVIRVPEIFSKHSLYYQGKWFKVLQVRLGFDFRFNTPWTPEYYNPVIGQFHLQNQQEAAFFPATDAYLAIRVATFRAYLKWEGLGSVILPGRYYYQSAFYAHPFPGLRFGLKWRLAD